MKLEIKNYIARSAAFGYVATFDVSIEGCITLKSMCLIRNDRSPGCAWLAFPNLARENSYAFSLAPKLRAEIARRACLMHEAATGIHLTYVPPSHHVAALASEHDEPAADEPADDAGLRRVIGADMEDALRQVAA